jgi:DNA-binding XRE family transcriptional regulator
VIVGKRIKQTERPSPIDIYVGSGMRMRRIAAGMSQEKLATGLGLTFQLTLVAARRSERR